jgi:hypothetical protein
MNSIRLGGGHCRVVQSKDIRRVAARVAKYQDAKGDPELPKLLGKTHHSLNRLLARASQSRSQRHRKRESQHHANG